MFIPHMKIRSGHKFPWQETPEGYLFATPFPERWTQGSEHNRVWGPDIASATTIAVTHMIHRVTGTTTIETITPPWPTFTGFVILIFTGAVTFGVTGNVLTAAASAAEEILIAIYNGTKWHIGVMNLT